VKARPPGLEHHAHQPVDGESERGQEKKTQMTTVRTKTGKEKHIEKRLGVFDQRNSVFQCLNASRSKRNPWFPKALVNGRRRKAGKKFVGDNKPGAYWIKIEKNPPARAHS